MRYKNREFVVNAEDWETLHMIRIYLDGNDQPDLAALLEKVMNAAMIVDLEDEDDDQE